MQRWLSGLTLVTLLSGCALLQPHDSVPLAGGGYWHLLAPAQLSAPARAIQRVDAKFGEHTAVFLFYLEASTEQLVLVGTTPDGTELFRLRQSAHGIEQKTAPFLPKQMHPTAVLADLQMVFAARDIVAKNLLGTGLAVQETTENGTAVRTISRDDSAAISIRCEAADCWQGKVYLQNHAWNYSYIVTPVELNR